MKQTLLMKHPYKKFKKGDTVTVDAELGNWLVSRHYAEPAGEKKPGAKPAGDDLARMTKEQLVVKLKEKGVEFDESAKKADLIALLQEKQ